jgi:hypothetical protein
MIKTAEDMLGVLKREYGINSQEEFWEMLKSYKGYSLDIFGGRKFEEVQNEEQKAERH